MLNNFSSKCINMTSLQSASTWQNDVRLELLLLCCCLHIKSRSGLYSVLSNIRTGPTDADAFRGHRLTTQKGYTYQKEIKGPRKVNTHAIIGK